MKPRILIVYTGGTIGMIEDPINKTLMPFDFSHLMENVPKVKMLDYDIDNIQFEQPIDSSDMNPDYWQQIVHSIADNYDKYDGFVVLHGTDTMAYTASALSFMLEGLNKPVIITGSQLPIGEVRTDGEENLITALQIAAAVDETSGQPMVQEVAILFENYLWRGNRSTKRSADNFNAFKSNNYPNLAKIGLGITYNKDALARVSRDSKLTPHFHLDTHVLIIDLFPGLNEVTLHHLLNTPNVKAIIMRTFGAGNSPTAGWFINAICETVRRGVIIVNVTQCVNGFVRSNRYVSGDILSASGVISGYDITVEAALTKLMYLFGMGLSRDEVADAMTRSIAGEMSVY
jgi:L-asparaginase